MPKVKIISNPYQKNTSFESWTDDLTGWRSVNIENNAGSELLKKELSEGFFPFQAKTILDVIYNEYSADDKVDIIFEGTDDEYREIESICKSAEYKDKVNLEKSNRYLENARDILPNVIEIYKKVNNIVNRIDFDDCEIRNKIEKFEDASNDEVPICVIGTYSSGKSTFINALIGYELLQSSENPTTAKIYKISKSTYDDRATISFKYNTEDFKINFYGDSYDIPNQENTDLYDLINAKLSDKHNKSINTLMAAVLEIINGNNNISEIVNIEAPFNEKGLLAKSNRKFVILDTPGSNSETYKKHSEVLSRAMDSQSNGLIVFVSEYKDLDRTDSAELYETLKKTEGFDTRFTMILVNKAEALSGIECNESGSPKILDLVIPRKLSSSGIYFVSSIVGLGSKNNGIFADDTYCEIFNDQSEKYSNPNSRFYKQLYKYNILPEQIKIKSDETSQNQKNKLYANSGLCSIENDINLFINKYSHYNKCQQSNIFLKDFINSAENKIEDIKEDIIKEKENDEKNLERDKREFIKKINSKSEQMKTNDVEEYKQEVSKKKEKAVEETGNKVKDLKEEYNKIRDDKREEKDVEGYKKNKQNSVKVIFENAKLNFENSVKDFDIKSFKEARNDFAQDRKDAVRANKEYKSVVKLSERESSDVLIDKVNMIVSDSINVIQNDIEVYSKKYWRGKSQKIRTEILNIVTNSDNLPQEKKEELKELIINYEDLSDLSVEKFEKTEFLHKVFDKERIRVKKLKEDYSDLTNKAIKEIFSGISENAENKFIIWCDNLVKKITDNIVEYSPDLKQKESFIKDKENKIKHREEDIIELKKYREKIVEMIDWKES